jgi:hypothetical protein
MIETKVVISVSGGNVNGIFTNNPDTKVYLVDYDNLDTDPNDDCSQRIPTGSISDFQARAIEEAKTFPGMTKLIAD